MKKLLLIALCVLVIVSSVFANGSSESAKKSGPVTLEILLSGDTSEGSPMQKAVARFNAEYKDKGIQAVVNEIANSDVATQINNRARAGELPALVKNTTATLDQFVDYYYPLDETGLNPDDFALNYCVRNGKFIATALNSTSPGLFINKTAFDAAGVSYPLTEEERWTWDEFIAALKVVMEKTGIKYGFGVDYSQDREQTILYQFGSRMSDPNNPKKLIFRSQETLDGIKFYINLYKDGICPITFGSGIDSPQNTFKTGTLAAHLGGTWSLTQYTNDIKDFEWTNVLMPYSKEKATQLGGNLLSVFKGTGVEKEAIEFVKWFYQEENYKQYLNDANYLSGVKTLDIEYNMPQLKLFQQEILSSWDAPSNDVLFRSAYAGYSYGNAIRDNMTAAVNGEITAEQALDRMVATILSSYPGLTE